MPIMRRIHLHSAADKTKTFRFAMLKTTWISQFLRTSHLNQAMIHVAHPHERYPLFSVVSHELLRSLVCNPGLYPKQLVGLFGLAGRR